MVDIERQFDYKPEAGSLKLLGILSIILSPLLMWMTFQPDDSNDGLFLFGKGWFAFIPPPLVPWVMRLFSLALIWIGYALIKGAAQMREYGGRIAFTPTGLIYEAGPPGGRKNEISYGDISDIRTSVKRNRKTLTFQRAGVGKVMIPSARMRSLDEFDEMTRLLQEHVAGRPLPAGAAGG